MAKFALPQLLIAALLTKEGLGEVLRMKVEDRSTETPSYVIMPEDLAEDGIDRTLIRFALRMSPAERLDHARGWADSLGRLADAAAVARRKQGSGRL